MGAAKFGRPQIVELGVTLGQTASMPSPDAAARHTGAGVARRQAHRERMRDERAREAAASDAELPPEDDAVEMASAVHVLDSVAEVGPNYTLLRSKETKAKRYGTKASKMSPKSVSRVCCSSAACARCRDAPLAGYTHSLGPRECVYPTGVSRLDAVLEMELQKVRRRACHRRRPGGGDGV